MPLDPIVSLSVALAEAPGSCAFLIGSGVSRDAGVPTGYEVMRDGLRRLYRLQEKTQDDPDDETLDAWLASAGFDGLTYSSLLELIAPDQAVRRSYLAGFFDGKDPGSAHERLADLAVAGHVRVFVTTNFDRLLEHALQARGIEPVVVASDHDLEAATPREHTSCMVIKPHGDYLRETIRNTPDELAILEPGITQELDEVFCRYGVVVLGYSGGDAAIAEQLRKRRSRMGVWWVARSELADAAQSTAETIAARVVQRDSASEFLADLRRRLATFDAHPTGDTPAVVHDGLLAMLRANDRVGLLETLRRERNWYADALSDIYARIRATYATWTRDALIDVWGWMMPVLERRLASLLPLALYDATSLNAEVTALARQLEQRPLDQQRGYDLGQWAATWLGYVLGGLLVREEEYERLGDLLMATWTDRTGYTQSLIFIPGEASHEFGTAVMFEAEPGTNYLIPAWELLTKRSLVDLDWLSERYPELSGDDEPRRSMAVFDLLVCIARGVKDDRALAIFTLGPNSANEFARRLHDDPALRARVAGLYGMTLEEFDATAPGLLRSVEPIRGGFVIDGPAKAARLLEGDSD